MLRDVQHRNHSPLSTILHWHYVRWGELFSIIPLMGQADHVVNGGLPFDLPALKPFFIGGGGYLPKPGDFDQYKGFLDAQIRYRRVKELLESVEGLDKGIAKNYDIIPGEAVIREFIGGSTVKIPHNVAAANRSAAIAVARFRTRSARFRRHERLRWAAVYPTNG